MAAVRRRRAGGTGDGWPRGAGVGASPSRSPQPWRTANSAAPAAAFVRLDGLDVGAMGALVEVASGAGAEQATQGQLGDTGEVADGVRAVLGEGGVAAVFGPTACAVGVRSSWRARYALRERQ